MRLDVITIFADYLAPLRLSLVGRAIADGLIDLIRIAEEAQVACLLREVGETRTKASLRSRGAIDVGSVAHALGGGGHHNAAGATVDGTLDSVQGWVFDRVSELLADLLQPTG